VTRNATGTWLPEFFRANLAQPLDIRHYHFNLMPNGDGYGAGGLYLRPRDQLKLGQLFLAGGVWNGRRVVSSDWVAQSTREHAIYSGHSYGLAWHLRTVAVGTRRYSLYAAEGNGGQLVIVVPDLQLVVQFSGGNYGAFPVWIKCVTELLPGFILPAVRAQ
jgi:CubicO group peptidase (beta-lactamase class C family)